MSISATIDFSAGRYTPFYQEVRGGEKGRSPVGTLQLVVADVGDMSGGTVALAITMERLTFGFRALIAPTLITAQDDLGTPEGIRLVFSAGNRRIGTAMEQVLVPIAGSGLNAVSFRTDGLVLESLELAAANMLQFIWSTNTNTVNYSGRIFASVFDAELIERQGSISDFLAGVR